MYIHLLYTDPYKWFLQTPKAMWSIMVKIFVHISEQNILKGADQTGTFMGLKCVVYYANYRSGH